MIDEIVAGVLVDAIAATGRRLGAYALAGRHRGADLGIARWFDTYQLTADPPDFPDLTAELTERLQGFLQGDDMQAVLHELLAARLSDAPEADVARIRAVFDLALNADLPDLASLGAELFGYYDTQICALAGRLEGSEPALLGQIRAEALSSRMIAILGAIERHAAALDSPGSRQGEAAFVARYRRHVISHHGRIEPPDFQRRLRVPIADLYVSPIITQTAGSGPPEERREVDLWALADEFDRAVLLGDPGGGKTTAANVLMHHYASGPGRRVPFLVTLREFASADPPQRSVSGHIEFRLDTFYQCPPPAGLVSRLLLTGASVVIFDGLDELLETARRLEVTAIVERFCAEYPLTPVLVTSRVVGYEEARLDDSQFVRYRIGGFGESQVGDYVRKWFALEALPGRGDDGRSADAFMEESASVPDLRANPLMLALMCILYRGEGSLPRNRAGIYGQCASLLFHRWDTRRRLHLELRAGHLLEPALRHLAWWMFTHGQAQPGVPERELVNQATAFLHGPGFESSTDARLAAEEFVEFCRGRMWVFTDTGTTATDEALYSFTHRTFLEYFAAAYLAYECDNPERLSRTLAPHAARHEWEIVGELAIQLKDGTSSRGAQRVYAALLDERRRRSTAGRGGILQFLARCLRSVDPSPQTARILTRHILDHLLGGNTDDPVHALPLCWLLACCDQHRDIVSDEISNRITQLVESADPQLQLTGVRLAAFLPFGVTWGAGGPDTSPTRPIYDFWWQRATRLLQANGVRVAAAAHDDPGVRFPALWWRVITLDQALSMPGGPGVLFQHTRQGIAEGSWAAYLPNIVHRLDHLGSRVSQPGEFVGDMAAFGRYLLAHPNPPWVSGPVENLRAYLATDHQSSDRPSPAVTLPAQAYVGATVTLFVCVESIEATGSLSASRDWVPRTLSSLYPYIERRFNKGSSARLPSLPIPDSFRQIAREWANNKINFVRKSPVNAIVPMPTHADAHY